MFNTGCRRQSYMGKTKLVWNTRYFATVRDTIHLLRINRINL